MSDDYKHGCKHQELFERIDREMKACITEGRFGRVNTTPGEMAEIFDEWKLAQKRIAELEADQSRLMRDMGIHVANIDKLVTENERMRTALESIAKVLGPTDET